MYLRLMATILILGVPFFSPELAKSKFGIDIPVGSYFTDIGKTQIFLTHESKNTWKCTVWVQGTEFCTESYAKTKEEAVFILVDKVRETIHTLPKIENALSECFSAFDVPTKKYPRL